MKQKTLVSVLWAVLMLISVTAQGATATDHQTVSKEYNLGQFSAIDVSSAVDVVFTPSTGSLCSVMAEGTASMIERLQVRVAGDVLTIRQRSNTKFSPRKDKLKVYVSAPALQSVTVSGASSIEVSRLSTPMLEVNGSGAGSVNIKQLVAEQVTVKVEAHPQQGLWCHLPRLRLQRRGIERESREPSCGNVLAICSGASNSVCYASRSVDARLPVPVVFTVKGKPAQTDVRSLAPLYQCQQ
jgi:hypothetical protein